METGMVLDTHVVFERRRPPPLGMASAASRPFAPSAGDALLAACQRIEAIGDTGERLRLLGAEVRKLGFDWMGFGYVDGTDGAVRPLEFSADLAHPRWVHQYFSRGYAACDPRLAAFARSNLPYVWNPRRLLLDGLASTACPKLLREFIDGLDGAGLRSGVFFGVPSMHGARRGFVSLASIRADCSWIDDACLGAVLTLGLACATVLGALQEGGRPADVAEPHELSETQREIVGCLRTGMSDKQIAYALSITRHNVDYHMRQLRRRYGARNRVQLAQRLTGPLVPPAEAGRAPARMAF